MTHSRGRPKAKNLQSITPFYRVLLLCSSSKEPVIEVFTLIKTTNLKSITRNEQGVDLIRKAIRPIRKTEFYEF